GPDGAVDEVLLLPDGDGLLEGVDDPAAGFEGGAAVGGGDRDEDAGLADFKPAQAMDEDDVADAEAGDGFGGERAHLFERHLLVGLVVEEEGLAAAGVVADDAVEDDH